MSMQEKRIIELLRAKRREDPKGFRKYLPSVAELLPRLPPERSKSKSPFGLTTQELSYHRNGLSEVLDRELEGVASAEDAAKGLQHCAALIRDDKLTDMVGYRMVKGLIRATIGRSPSSYRSKTTVPLDEGGGPVLERISAIRGVYFNLDRDRRLVSISIHPGKMKERSRLMEVIGIGKDPEADVASKHDDYLAVQGPHGDV